MDGPRDQSHTGRPPKSKQIMEVRIFAKRRERREKILAASLDDHFAEKNMISQMKSRSERENILRFCSVPFRTRKKALCNRSYFYVAGQKSTERVVSTKRPRNSKDDRQGQGGREGGRDSRYRL